MVKNTINSSKKEDVKRKPINYSCSDCPYCNWFYEKSPFKEGWKKELKELRSRIKKIREVWTSSKDAYEKKIALFELVVDVEFEEIEPQENEKINCLLRSRLYNELAKDNYRRYQQARIDEFTKDKDK